jgi:hypothetical protein
MVAPANQVSVPVGGFLFVPVTVFFSDYQSHLNGLDSIIEFTNTASEFADILFQSNIAQLLIKGKQAGATTVTAAPRTGLFPKRLPDYSLSAPVLNVTVTL